MTASTATARRTETSLIRWCPHSALFLSRDPTPQIRVPLGLYSLSPGLPLFDLTQHGLQSHHHSSSFRPLTNPVTGSAFGTCHLISSYLPYLGCFYSRLSFYLHETVSLLCVLCLFFKRRLFFLYVIKPHFSSLFFYRDYFLFLFLPAFLFLSLAHFLFLFNFCFFFPPCLPLSSSHSPPTSCLCSTQDLVRQD